MQLAARAIADLLANGAKGVLGGTGKHDRLGGSGARGVGSSEVLRFGIVRRPSFRTPGLPSSRLLTRAPASIAIDTGDAELLIETEMFGQVGTIHEEA
jgi:hypothetical protein